MSAHLSVRVGPLLLQQLNVSLQSGDADVFLSDLLHVVSLDLMQTGELALQVHQPLTAFQRLCRRLSHDRV